MRARGADEAANIIAGSGSARSLGHGRATRTITAGSSASSTGAGGRWGAGAQWRQRAGHAEVLAVAPRQAAAVVGALVIAAAVLNVACVELRRIVAIGLWWQWADAVRNTAVVFTSTVGGALGGVVTMPRRMGDAGCGWRARLGELLLDGPRGLGIGGVGGLGRGSFGLGVSGVAGRAVQVGVGGLRVAGDESEAEHREDPGGPRRTQRGCWVVHRRANCALRTSV